MSGRLAILGVVVGLLALPGGASAAPPANCGLPAPDQSVTGTFTSAQQGSFVFVPFDVPAGTTQVRVAYCWDPSAGTSDHTLDLGLYQTRSDPSKPWGMADFRGWGGSGYRDVTVTPQGFSTEAEYDADRKAYRPGRTTRSFVPGPIPAGQWAAELGLANIDPTDPNGVDYRVEVQYYNDPTFDDVPYTKPPHDPTPIRAGRAWYAGDFHVHAEHSGDAQASFTDVLDYAFKPKATGGPGLDFVALTDHNTGTGWPEEDRRRADHPDNLVMRGEEVTTYNGHTNNIASGVEPDYRTGPLFERQSNGTLAPMRAAQPVSKVFDADHSGGGIAQINHPTIFPSPPFPSNLCRGCSWTHTEANTNYSKVDSMEVTTGPQKIGGTAPNPFIPTAISFWEAQLNKGHHIAAVGGSDDHSAATGTGPTDAPIGQPTTMVYADELSEPGVVRAVKAGHTYVKVGGPAAPDVRLTGRARGAGGPESMMGDTIHSDGPIDFRAGVTGAGVGYLLEVIKNGLPIKLVPITGASASTTFSSTGPGFYRLQVMRGPLVSDVSSPIYATGAAGRPVASPGTGAKPARRPRLRVALGRHTRVRHGRFRLRCRVSGKGRRVCRVRIRARLRGHLHTVGYAKATVSGRSRLLRIKLNRRGRRLLALRHGRLPVRVKLRASGRGYKVGRAWKRFTLHDR